MADPTAPPPGFITIAEIDRTLLKQFVNLIGIVVDLREPTQSRGGDWMLTLRLCDRTRALASTSFTLRYFKSQPLLPRVHNPGDILIIRRLKIAEYSGQLLGLAHYDTETVTLYSIPPAGGAPHRFGSFAGALTPPTRCGRPSPAELEFANGLKQFWEDRGGETAALGVSKEVYEAKVRPAIEKRRKFSLVKDLQYDGFYDIAGEVVKTFGGVGGSQWFTVYLSDYTKHPQLYNYDWDKVYASTYGDEEYDYTGRGGGGYCPPVVNTGERNWPGPLGRYTIQITLWDEHAVAARSMELEGNMVLLQNVLVRRNKDGNMEGWINGDKMYPDRPGIEILKNGELRKEVRQRKEVYMRAFERQKMEYEGVLLKKREEEEARRVKAREQEQERLREVNPNVACDRIRIPDSDELLPTTSFSEILNVAKIQRKSFLNNRYRIYARVIDFLPDNLEDFAVKVTFPEKYKRRKLASGKPRPQRKPEDTDTDEDYDATQKLEEVDENGKLIKWEWRFGLVLQDKEGISLPVVVDNYGAQMLLGMDACDLRKNQQHLSQLREKLFVLWGTVEEYKQKKLDLLALEIEKRKTLKRKKPGDQVESDLEAVEKRIGEIVGSFESGRWFEGALEEYGIPGDGGDGWKRRWGLQNTRIKA